MEDYLVGIQALRTLLSSASRGSPGSVWSSYTFFPPELYDVCFNHRAIILFKNNHPSIKVLSTVKVNHRRDGLRMDLNCVLNKQEETSPYLQTQSFLYVPCYQHRQQIACNLLKPIFLCPYLLFLLSLSWSLCGVDFLYFSFLSIKMPHFDSGESHVSILAERICGVRGLDTGYVPVWWPWKGRTDFLSKAPASPHAACTTWLLSYLSSFSLFLKHRQGSLVLTQGNYTKNSSHW